MALAVDVGTGHVEIPDYVGVEDAGRAINQALVHGQTFGAVIWGSTGVFLDNIVCNSDAQLLKASLCRLSVGQR
jgi:carbon-monoxide dehydrogenase large subunit